MERQNIRFQETEIQKEKGLSEIDVSEFISRLRKHNKKFIKYINIDSSKKADEDIARDGDLELISAEFKNEIEKTGVDFELKEIGTIVSPDDQEDITIEEVRPFISSWKVFGTYVGSFDNFNITAEQKDSIINKIRMTDISFDDLDIENPDDAEKIMEIVRNGNTAIEQIKKVDMIYREVEEEIMSLEEMINQARKKTLKEYLLAKNLRLNKPFEPTGYILRWQIDCSGKSFLSSWNKVLSTLLEIYKNENARDVYNQAKETAVQAISSAILELIHRSGKEDEREHVESLLNIATTIRNRLNDY